MGRFGHTEHKESQAQAEGICARGAARDLERPGDMGPVRQSTRGVLAAEMGSGAAAAGHVAGRGGR